MTSSLVFCILVATLTLAQCNAKLKKEPRDFDEYEETECYAVRSRIGHTVKNSVCQPRAKHVYLKPQPGYEYRPPMVTVRRCGGHCSPGYTPTPTNTTLTEFATQMHRKGNPAVDLKCVLVKVKEHTMCSCMCPKREKDCNRNQIYEESSCSCRCKNENFKKFQCEAELGKVWDDDECSCNCTKMDIECETGRRWDSVTCQCVDRY